MRLESVYIQGVSLQVNVESFFGQRVRGGCEYEERETALVKGLIRQGDVCLDIGAHYGYYSCLMAQRGAKVLAFECNPNLLPLTHRNCEAVGATVFEFALSDTNNSEVTFYMPSAWNDGWGSLGASDQGRQSAIKVVTRRAEQYLPEGRIRLVKIDVEGAEALVLKGFGDRLKDVDYFLIECIDRNDRVETLHSSVHTINDILLSAGYTVWRATPGNTWQVVPSAYSDDSFCFLFAHPESGMSQ